MKKTLFIILFSCFFVKCICYKDDIKIAPIGNLGLIPRSSSSHDESCFPLSATIENAIKKL